MFEARCTRRELLVGAGGLAGLAVLAPLSGRVGTAFGAAPVDPATAGRNRLVIVFLTGGNDGLNTVVPRGDVTGAPRYSVYRKVRPTIAYPAEATLPLDRPGDADHALGLNPRLGTLHALYREGRVAIVQGVDYPKHSYSHFTSTDIWHSGEPEHAPESGWLGRHLDRVGIGEGELRAVAIGTELPLMLQGRSRAGAAISSIAATRFADGAGSEAAARHQALLAYGGFAGSDPLRLAVGRRAAEAVGLVETLASAPNPPSTGSSVADALLTARALLQHPLGVESVFLQHGNFDTHAAQVPAHERALSDLDAALEAFWLGTYRGSPVAGLGPMPPTLAARTLVLLVSEFGRRIGENGGAGAAGTDHGAAAPVILIGPPSGSGRSLAAGLHGDHPAMGSAALPADNLGQTTDLRRVYEAVLADWLGDPDPAYARIGPLAGLFAAATTVVAPKREPRQVAAPSTTPASATTAESAPSLPLATVPSSAAPARLVVRPPRSRPRAGSSLHPVSVLAAVAGNLLAAALAVRAGGLARLRAVVHGSDEGERERAAR